MAEEKENLLSDIAKSLTTLAEGFRSFKSSIGEKHAEYDRRIKALEDRPSGSQTAE